MEKQGNSFPQDRPIRRSMSSVAALGKDRLLAALDKLPPFSPVLTRVLAKLGDEDFSFSELAAIIETDTVLAGNILRVVNSPLYGRASTINSVRHAVAIIGANRIRNLVLGLSVSRRWTGTLLPKRWDARQFNLHSMAVALLSDLLALNLRVPYPEGAFVAGLLHDIGKLLIAVAAPDELGAICEACAQGQGDAAERELLGAAHAEISGAVLEKWKLPKPIQEAAAFHHLPDEADGGRLHLAHIVEAADLYTNEHKFGMDAYVIQTTARGTDPFQLAPHIESAAESFQTEFEAIRVLL